MSPRKTPVIIGVGDYINRSKKVEDAIEPVQLMLLAIREALQDIGLTNTSELQSTIDSIDVVKSWTWPCDYPSLLAQKLNCKPVHAEYSEHGGNQPAKLVDDAARRISLGETKVAVVTGGEALASLTACANAGKFPPEGWEKPTEDVTKVFSPTTRELIPSEFRWLDERGEEGEADEGLDYGAKHEIGNPVQLYPLYENAFRAHRSQSIPDNHEESAQLYADFAKVAEKHPYAWSYGSPAETKESIATVSKRNRMICFPYPLLMNAFNTVNLAAACILTSTEHARELGISSEKWIYPLGGAGTADSFDFWKRPAYWWSPSISRSLDAALEASSLETNDIDLFDFYSCFPIVPKLAAAHLQLPPSKPLTLLGGLTSFGGAGNNYSLHAITELTRRLRLNDNNKTGLVLANGGWVTYQHVLCLSSSPRSDGLPYPDSPPLPKYVTDLFVPPIAEKAEGAAVVETYTVEYDRENTPTKGHVVGRLLGNGHRFLANHADEETLRELASWEREQVGRAGRVKHGEDGKNLFSFAGEVAKL